MWQRLDTCSGRQDFFQTSNEKAKSSCWICAKNEQWFSQLVELSWPACQPLIMGVSLMCVSWESARIRVECPLWLCSAKLEIRVMPIIVAEILDCTSLVQDRRGCWGFSGNRWMRGSVTYRAGVKGWQLGCDGDERYLVEAVTQILLIITEFGCKFMYIQHRCTVKNKKNKKHSYISGTKMLHFQSNKN